MASVVIAACKQVEIKMVKLKQNRSDFVLQ